MDWLANQLPSTVQAPIYVDDICISAAPKTRVQVYVPGFNNLEYHYWIREALQPQTFTWKIMNGSRHRDKCVKIPCISSGTTHTSSLKAHAAGRGDWQRSYMVPHSLTDCVPKNETDSLYSPHSLYQRYNLGNQSECASVPPSSSFLGTSSLQPPCPLNTYPCHAPYCNQQKIE